jgi:hypothetical protein
LELIISPDVALAGTSDLVSGNQALGLKVVENSRCRISRVDTVTYEQAPA